VKKDPFLPDLSCNNRNIQNWIPKGTKGRNS